MGIFRILFYAPTIKTEIYNSNCIGITPAVDCLLEDGMALADGDDTFGGGIRGFFA